METDYYNTIFELMKENSFNENVGLFTISPEEKTSFLSEDLGDYLPFIFYIKKKTFAKKHYKTIMKTYSSSLTVEKKKFGIHYLSLYEYSDFLFGLIDAYNETKDKELLNYIEKITQRLISDFNLGASMKSFQFFIFSKEIKGITIKENNFGFFIELFIELHKITQKKKYLNIANHLYKEILSDSFFRKNKVLREYTHFFSFLTKEKVKIMKTNTNSLYGVLELYKVTQRKEIKRVLEEWIKTLLSLTTNLPAQLYFKNGKAWKNDGSYPLTASFALIDFICDYTFFTKDFSFLKNAEEIAKKWMSIQGKTGLFPYDYFKKQSDLDNNTDFATSLVKLAELTKDESYLICAKKIIKAIKEKHFQKELGLVLGVHIDTGELLNKKIKTKFNFLFIKTKILEDSKYNIYGQKNLRAYELLKDR